MYFRRMQKVQEIHQQSLTQLLQVYSKNEAESILSIIWEELAGWGRAQRVLNNNEVVDNAVLKRYNSIIEELLTEKPLQQVLGYADFYDNRFRVNEHTLIPRPETEELVAMIIADYKGKRGLKVLDIGTGTGCIAISLALNLPDSKVTAVDISMGALAMAKENAKDLNALVEFKELDILAVVEREALGQFDIIVSNPPYVRESEKAMMRKNVLDYEPHTALFVKDEDPLLFYEAISTFAKQHLNEGGGLYFETNQYLEKELSELIDKKEFKEYTLSKDLSDNFRMLKAFV